MKITRSYLLGVGSGLMLSVLFTISLQALGVQDFSQLSQLVGLSKLTSLPTTKPSNQSQRTPQENALSQSSQGLPVGTPDSKGLGSGKSEVLKDSPLVSNSPVAPNIKTPLVPNNPTDSSTAAASNPIPTPSIPATPSTPNPKDPSILKGATQPLESKFFIPNGVSSERVADLLIGQGYITDRTKFLELVDKRGVAGKFQSGTYNLLPGLSYDEVLNRLMGRR